MKDTKERGHHIRRNHVDRMIGEVSFVFYFVRFRQVHQCHIPHDNLYCILSSSFLRDLVRGVTLYEF